MPRRENAMDFGLQNKRAFVPESASTLDTAKAR
jgi:hypothetical protein